MVHASLFSGIGGPEVAAAMLGWDNAFHCEINPFCRKVLTYWFPNSKSYEDIKKADFSEWRGKIDVLTGGFPCQPFSYAGKRRGSDDNRYLWPEMLRVIKEIRPTWIVGENVAGITTMVEQCKAVGMEVQTSYVGEVRIEKFKYRFTIERVCGELEAAGYSVQPIIIPACAVGAPHRRDRVFIIANRNETRIERMQQRRKDNICKPIIASDPFSDGKPAQRSSGCEGEEMEEKCKNKSLNEFIGHCSDGNRWQNFPTVSPVHRGNDGLPFDVDNLTIPFSQWRNQSIKAYGNAIVPQVMYEIFRAIDMFS